MSVDTITGYVLISWEKESSLDVKRYRIWKGEGTTNDPAFLIDSVDVPATSYIHQSSDALTGSAAYTIESVLTNGMSSFFAVPHYTIYASVKYDSCQNSFIIEWTPYVGWNNNLIAYNVYIKADSGEHIKIPPLSSTTTSYIYTGVIPYTDYCIFVEAENRNFLTSTSNQVCLNTNRASPPSYINADFATVTKDKTIQLSFSFDPITQVHNFILFHGRSESNIVDLVAEFNNVTTGSINYTHEVFSTKKGKNYYQLAAVDQCPEKNTLKKSNIAGNIILQCDSVKNLLVTLRWDDYQEWQAGVKYYNVYRITDKTNIELINSLNYGINTITDDISLLGNSENMISDEICYYIEAEENDDNIYGIKGYSRSNKVCVTALSKIHMANAFTPDGNLINDRIKPVLAFRPEKYLFAVYDRWGSKIFETTNPDEYWYGDVNNKKNAPPGVYIYYVKTTSSNNIVYEDKGTITLFYP